MFSALVISVNFRSGLIRASSSRCATSCLMRKSLACFTSLRAKQADNGNRSQVHWDMVSIQRPEYGGGEIYFDCKLIRRDGEFLPKQLRSLNRGRFGGKRG